MRESQILTSKTHLNSVPTSETHDTLLHIYDIDDRIGAELLVRFITEGGDKTVIERYITTRGRGGTPFPSEPGYAQVELSDLKIPLGTVLSSR